MKKIIGVFLLSLSIISWAQNDTLTSAPNFKLVSANGDSVSLSDFKGKIVYLDFWASWCGPCMSEMKHSKKLASKFKDNPNVVFLYVSIDTYEDKWKAALKRLDLGGTHLISHAAKEGNINKNYKLRSIPRYVLINKEGKVVAFDAKAPSERGIEKLIEELL